MDESNRNSSAYSSLTNSMTDINQLKIINEDGKCVDQIRTITEDYNSLVRRAAGQIKAMAAEKFEIEEQCEKMMALNEELVKDLAKVIRRETKLKQEHEEVLKANAELFDETQRLTDEEEKWQSEKERFETEITELKDQIVAIEERVKAKSGEDSQEVSRLRDEVQRLESEVRKLREVKHDLESRLQAAEKDKESWMVRKEKVAGENLQLMVDAEAQARDYHERIIRLQGQLQKSQDRCRDLEKENASLHMSASAPMSQRESPSQPSDEKLSKQLEKLREQNKNLTEWREQLITKNKTLNEENAKLKEKCQNLEDLLNEEETDISDVLELIKKMQVNGSSPTNANPKMGPISKFRGLEF